MERALLKQLRLSVGLLINKHFREARLLVAFYHEFKHFVQLSVILTEYFLAVHLAERAECYATVCLQDKV